MFPGAAERVQLDAGGISIVSTAARVAVEGFLSELACRPDEAHSDEKGIEAARHAAAAMIGARPDQVALISSTSAGLNIVANVVELGRGDNLVTTDSEFVSVVAPFQQRCREAGATLRIAHNDGAVVPAERILELIDVHTRAVVISTVVWTTGYRHDVGTLASECRRLGVPIIVDAIQQLGAIPFDVAECPVDVLICGGHKWLASPSGMGFLYASDAFTLGHAPRLPYAPTTLATKSAWKQLWAQPDFSPFRDYPPPDGALRFEIGHHHANMAARGLAAALGVFESVGSESVSEHVMALGDLVARGLDALGVEVVTPLDERSRSGITTFRAGASAEDDIKMVGFLRERGIVTSVRYTAGLGGTRVCCHLYNNADDVNRLLSTVRAGLGR